MSGSPLMLAAWAAQLVGSPMMLPAPRCRSRLVTFGPTVRDETNPSSVHFVGPPEPSREQRRRMRQAQALAAKRAR